MESHYYNVHVQWNKDRRGIMCSPELNVPASENGCIEVATPPEFPKGIPGIWSPEHLFTASVSSCLMTLFSPLPKTANWNFCLSIAIQKENWNTRTEN